MEYKKITPYSFETTSTTLTKLMLLDFLLPSLTVFNLLAKACMRMA